MKEFVSEIQRQTKSGELRCAADVAGTFYLIWQVIRNGIVLDFWCASVKVYSSRQFHSDSSIQVAPFRLLIEWFDFGYNTSAE